MQQANVHWLAKYAQPWDNEPHVHSFYQLLLTMGGNGYITVAGNIYSTERGQLLLIPPSVPHAVMRTDASEKSPPKAIDVKFSVPDRELSAELQKLPLCVTPSNFEYYQVKLENLIGEAQGRELYSGDAVNLSFTVLLISLIRSCHGDRPDLREEAERTETLQVRLKGVDVSQLLQFINQNFNRIISLEDLSNFAHVNKTTLIFIFRQFYSTTPIKYINDLRMRKAKDLLRNSDISISEISELVGFQSIHYFSRSFKEREGCSPLVYRREHQESQFITLSEAAQIDLPH